MLRALLLGMTTTKEQIRAAMAIVHALAEAIRELGQVPAGHLYANVMGKLTHGQFEQAIGILVRAGVVRREPSHLLVWTGPELAK